MSRTIRARLKKRMAGHGYAVQTVDPFDLAESLTSEFVVLRSGTSIEAFSIGSFQKSGEVLKSVWGDAGTRVTMLGGIGGSYTNIYTGNWFRQPAGCLSFVRLRGTNTVTAGVSRYGYGNRVDYYDSVETDAEEHSITVTNGSGTFTATYPVGGPGPQKYGRRASIDLPLDAYTVTINAPLGAGYAYPERLEIRNTNAKGITIVDAAYGGSALYHAVTLQTPSGSQVAGVTIVGDNGINAQTDAPDIDMFMTGYLVNDSGIDNGSVSGWVRSGAYATAVGKVLTSVRSRGIPSIYNIEMAGHYIMPNDAGDGGNRYASYNVAKAVLQAQNGNGVYVLDWDSTNRNDADIPAYAAAYYAVTGLNVSAGTYSGDFIHPTWPGIVPLDALLGTRLGITIPTNSSIDKEVTARFRSFPSNLRGTRTVVVDGVGKSLTAVASAVQPLCEGPKDQSRLIPVFVDATATLTANATTQRANIAASVTSDAFGKYLDLTNYSLGSFASGVDYWVTVKMSGNPQVRSNSATIRIYIDGKMMPYTDTTNFRTNIAGPSMTAGVDAPWVIAIRVRASAASQTLIFSTGRMYDIAVTQSDYPVMLVAP